MRNRRASGLKTPAGLVQDLFNYEGRKARRAEHRGAIALDHHDERGFTWLSSTAEPPAPLRCISASKGGVSILSVAGGSPLFSLLGRRLARTATTSRPPGLEERAGAGLVGRVEPAIIDTLVIALADGGHRNRSSRATRCSCGALTDADAEMPLPARLVPAVTGRAPWRAAAPFKEHSPGRAATG